MTRPNVLLVLRTEFEECAAILKGVAHFERTHRPWATYHDDRAVAANDLGWLEAKAWRGVISRHTTPPFAARCAQLGIPLVDLNDTEPIPGVPKVRPDNARVGRVGAEHFLERGFRNFGFAGFADLSCSQERQCGFAEALLETGYPCSTVDVPYPPEGVTPRWDDRQVDELAAWIEGLPKPLAVMACMDLRAIQVLHAAGAAGLRVPDDIAVLGVNNDTYRCELSIPALSSVAPNAFQAGYRAAIALNDLLAGRPLASFDQRIEPSGVVTRLSTSVLAIDDERVANAIGFIRENARKGLTADKVAETMHVSRSLMEKKFRQYIGRSPQAEIRRVQMARICQLLVDTDYPLKRIAELTGFKHTEYMSVLFKRETGDSPGHYRTVMKDKATVRSTLEQPDERHDASLAGSEAVLGSS